MKQLLLLIFVVLMSFPVLAEDEQMFQTCFGDEEAFVFCGIYEEGLDYTVAELVERYWFIATVFVLLSVVFILMLLYLIEGDKYTSILWLGLIFVFMFLLTSFAYHGLQAKQSDIDDAQVRADVNEHLLASLDITSNLIWIIGIFLFILLLLVVVKQLYLAKYKNS